VGLTVRAMVGGGVQIGAAQESGSADRLRVFFDCQMMGCFDEDYFVRGIPWVDWVRDREDSDVHLLTTGTSAGGGFSFDIQFIGSGDFEGQDVALGVFSSSTDTDDERREMLLGRYELALAAFAGRTGMADLLSVEYADPDSGGGRTQQPPAGEVDDPWDLWVFTLGLNGGGNGESSFSSFRASASAGADRISEEWKFTSDFRFSYNESEFEVPDAEPITTLRRSSSASMLLVRSLGPQWGIGGRTSVSSSTFSNYDLVATVRPALEYNVFPYAESSRRILTFQYQIGPEFVRYDEPTVFDEEEEWIFRNSLSATLGARQPWGSASIAVSGQAFVDDWEKNSISAFGNLQLRITRGLNLNFFGNISRIRDRVNEPGTDATEEDILLRQRILATSISYRFSVGLSYRFGSIFNNVVNPRFGGVFF